LRPHASHTPFEVRRRLVLSLIIPHIGYGGFVYAGADAASQRRLNLAFRACLRYINSLRRFNHVSHFETSVMGASLVDYARMQVFLFLCCMSGIRAICFPYFVLLRLRVQGI
jgi:hypothetical protein